MTTKFRHSIRMVCLLAAVSLVAISAATVMEAQQFPAPKSAADVRGTPAGTEMTKEYVATVGRLAYIWGWPLVNMANRAGAFSKAPEPDLLGGVGGGLALLTFERRRRRRLPQRPHRGHR